MLQNTKPLDAIPNNDAINQVQPTEVIQEEDTDNQDDDYMTYVSPEFEKELIEFGKGLQDGSQLFSPEINARIAELFGKAVNAPLGQQKAIMDEAFRIAGCL